jgi:hypothetical protein
VNVFVAPSVVVNVQANASVTAAAQTQAQTIVSGGGGASGIIAGPVSAVNLGVGGGSEREAYEATRTRFEKVVIQAFCFDDKEVPHPASQVGPDRDIDEMYDGEIYRCIAGTHMQVTMADFGICDDFGPAGEARISESESSSYSRSESHYESGYAGEGGYAHGGGYGEGERHESHMMTPVRHVGCGANMDFSHVNFDGGKMMTCQKGDALWFEHGNLTCRVQIPQRQCNERSLLRRFGTGIKVLTVTRIETTQRQVARQFERSSASSTVMTFNGGVGGFVE